jgi:pantoate--beta-alanine ligase
MAADLDLRVTVVGAPTVREPDGLALSSRNVYLSPEERARAPSLQRVLKQCAARIIRGDVIAAVTAEGAAELARDGFAVDYLAARHAETLAPLESIADGPIRLLVAARLGKTRLIDNIGV